MAVVEPGVRPQCLLGHVGAAPFLTKSPVFTQQFSAVFTNNFVVLSRRVACSPSLCGPC